MLLNLQLEFEMCFDSAHFYPEKIIKERADVRAFYPIASRIIKMKRLWNFAADVLTLYKKTITWPLLPRCSICVVSVSQVCC